MSEIDDFLERHADAIREKLDKQARLERIPGTERAVLDFLSSYVGLPERFVRQDPPEPRKFAERYRHMIYGVVVNRS